MAKMKPSKMKKIRHDEYTRKNSYVVNKTRALARHVKKFPNDAVAAAALKSPSNGQRRSTPNESLGWVQASVKNATTGVLTKERAVALATIAKFSRKIQNVYWHSGHARRPSSNAVV